MATQILFPLLAFDRLAYAATKRCLSWLSFHIIIEDCKNGSCCRKERVHKMLGRRNIDETGKLILASTESFTKQAKDRLDHSTIP